MRLSYRQRGLSTLSILVIVLVAVFFSTCAITMLPAYTEYLSVKRAVESMIEQSTDKNFAIAEMKTKLAKQYQVNRIEVVNAKQAKITRQKGITTVDARYEQRIPLMFNIDVVIKFDQLLYEMSGPAKQ